MIWNENDVIFDAYIGTVLCTLYILLFIAGLSGNLCLMFAVLRRRSVRRSSMHCLLANTASANCLLCLTSIPSIVLPPYLGGWYFGALACYMSILLPSAAVFNLALTAVFLALERYYIVRHPLKEYAVLSSSYIFATIVVVWIASSLIALPYTLQTNFVISPSRAPQCLVVFPNSVINIFWAIAFFLTSSLPLLVGFVIYGVTLSRSSRASVTDTIQQTHPSNDIAYEYRKCVVAMKVSLMLGVCWLPYNSICGLNKLTGESLGRFYALAQLTGLLIALSSVIWLPIICFLGDDLLHAVGKDITKNKNWTLVDKNAEAVIVKEDLLEWL